jgi:aspartate/methionine/tyrosine aminotransferase
MISKEDLNRNLLDAQYAVRGPIVERAQQLEEQGRKIIYCNIGNPLSFKQRPLTYIRQVLSLIEYPSLLSAPAARNMFPNDVLEKAKWILQQHPSGTGAYSQSVGVPFIRQAVADFIHRRDAIPASKRNVILTDGASKGAQAVLLALLKHPDDGFMIPIPQYPLYSATIALYGGRQIGYYLDEANHWQLSEEKLTEGLDRARSEGIHPVVLVVINPGNPTGAVLSAENIRMIVRFARKNRLSIIAD